MQDEKQLLERIDESIMAAYAASSDASTVQQLKKYVEAWDDLDYPGKDEAGIRLAKDLQALISHFEKKGLKSQADEVFLVLLQTFPESHFSAAPLQTAAISTPVDFASLRVMDLGLESDEEIVEIRTAVDCFEHHFTQALSDLPQLAREIEMKLFREMATGDVAELYRQFKAVASAVQNTPLRDAPWAFMNQLALKLNNELKAFNQAYTLLHEILEIKVAEPSEELRSELEKNEIFFLRNYYWKRIDDAVAGKDNSAVVFYVDKLMPMSQGGHERSNLLMLRSNAIKRNDEPIRGCVTFFAVVVVAMLCINILLNIFSGNGRGKDGGQVPSRWQAFWSQFAPKSESDLAIDFSATQNSLRVLNNAGLDEVKPPDQPVDRKLNILELRHVVFQRIRLEHLSQQELTPEEQEHVNRLWEDWRKRCEFYKYDAEDRERAETEAQRHMKSLVDDAENIKNSIASVSSEEATPPEEHEKFEQHKILLSLDNPAHVKRIIGRLAQFGYYKGDLNATAWNSQARKALIEFKVARMSVLDDAWDMKTQEALLGR
jgi:hypothetical protein